MWFWFAILTLFCWSFSDLFSKIGCREPSEKSGYLKMISAVGFVMGLHALYEIVISGVAIDAKSFLIYLPVSILYITSMAFSYIAFRYIELSIASPICNSSGALVAIFSFIVYGFAEDMPRIAFFAVGLVCAGVIFLGVAESTEDEDLRRARQDESNYHYAKSALAILFPILYCVLDAAGTFADSFVLDRYLDETVANCCYELTFFAVGLLCFIYVVAIKKESYVIKKESPKFIGAIFETIGQFFYISALADTEHVAFSAPIMASFCLMSVVLSRVFLKEKLSRRHYAAIGIAASGIVLMGVVGL